MFFSQGKIRGIGFLNKKRIVFVTVGTDPQPFNRLLQAIDQLAQKGVFATAVFCQTGYSTYRPRFATAKAFLNFEEFEEKIQEAALVISHGGAGSIGTALQFRKKCIAIPRLKRFGEHANDHQVELVQALEKEGLILAAYNEEELGKKIERSKKWEIKRFSPTEKKSIALLEEFVKKNFQ